jgi:DNA replication and repair protein RecF
MGLPARFISRLRLSAFRNYASAALDLDHRHVVLTGRNGAGKTNLLEAVSLLSPGRGLRRAPFDTLAQVGSEGQWAVAATVETPAGPVDIGTGAGPGPGSRRVRINGANSRNIEEMSAYVRLLWLTPAMDGLFSGPPADRRRFLDRLVTTLIPGHATTANAFETAMRQRNKLLDEGGDAAWLTAIETQMAEYASAIHFARADCIGHLQRLAAESVDEAAFPAAALALSPLFSDADDPNSSTALESRLTATWRDARALDRAAGRTTSGPHRCDLEVSHRQKHMPANLCSTGEQKALLIGLVLAHARLVKRMTGITPLLLLDEVAAHLDPGRREALFLALDALETQCWMSGTDPVLFDALGHRAQTITVVDGRVLPDD